MRNRIRKIILTVLLPAMFCHGMCLRAPAAVAGSGTEDDPAEGTVYTEDTVPADAWVRNLADTDGTTIVLEGNYSPNTYRLGFDAAGGSFPDGSSEIRLDEVYADTVRLPEDPGKEDAYFAGWYLKGNRREDPEEEGNTEILSEESIYLLAADDPEDMAEAFTDEDGSPVARALWRNNTAPSGRGSEADYPQDAGVRDLWDARHTNNHIIEWIPSLPEKADYRSVHGSTRYSYGCAVLDAGTDEAASYTWYRKGKNETAYAPTGQDSSVAEFPGLTREDDGSRIRCVVEIGERGDRLVYETVLTVWWLPVRL